MERTRVALIYVLLLLPLARPQSSSLVCIKSTTDKSGQVCAYQLNSGETDNAIKDLKGELSTLRQQVEDLNASNNGELTTLRQQVVALNSSNNGELTTLRQQVEARNARNNGELTTLRQQVEALNASNNGELTTLRLQVGNLESSNFELRRAAIGTMNGWYSPLNGYQYRVTPDTQSWDASRDICRGWGGDLVVHGIRTRDSRRYLMYALSSTSYWIGANDKENEGTWKWVNGDNASFAQIMWAFAQPDNNQDNEDCAEIIGAFSNNGESFDELCSLQKSGLCEKPIF